MMQGSFNPREMHRKIQMADFFLTDFLREHKEDIVIILTGKWKFEIKEGRWRCQTFYQGKYITREKKFTNLKSPNVAMLLGAIACCEHIKLKNKKVYFLVPTELGFLSAAKGKGVNCPYIDQLYQICNEKNLEIHSLAVLNGGYFFQKQVNSATKVFYEDDC